MSNRPNHRESEQEVLNEARNAFGALDTVLQGVLPGGASTAPVTATVVGSSTALDVNVVQTTGGSGGGLTDAELRATPVPVSGTVTVDTSLLATSAKQLADNHQVTVSNIASTPVISGFATSAKQDTIIGHVDGIETLLGTIDTDTGNIAASTATIAGAVSGTEMQVDVLTLPAITATNLDIRDLTSASDSVLIYGSDDGGTTKRVIKTDAGGAIQVDLEVASASVTQGTSPWIVAGGGTAGTAATGVVTVQGIASMTPIQVGDNSASLSVDWNGTQPVTSSGTATGALRVELPTNGTGVIATVSAVTAITNALPVGANVIGKVSIDQATPGTTNLVALTAETTKVIGTVRVASGGIASGAIASGAVASGAIASGAIAAGAVAAGAYVSGSILSGALASGAVVDITNVSTPVTPATATATKAINLGAEYRSTLPTWTNTQQGALQVGTRRSLHVELFNTDSATAVPSGSGTATGAVRVELPTNGTGVVGLNAGTNAIGKLAANSGVDIGDVDVTSINAFVAHDSPIAGNPLTIGGVASAAAPTSVSADQDSVRAWYLRNGAAATVVTAAGALIGGDAANGLDVDVTRLPALVAGTANIGDVDVLTIAAGDNNIGNVDIVTVPTDPFGANADAASATGSISAKLRGIATALGVTALDLGSGTGGSRTLRTFIDTAQTVLPVGGNVAHDAADSGNPVKIGGKAVSHGATPTAVAAADRTDQLFNRHGMPFVSVGHPNLQTIEYNHSASTTNFKAIAAASNVVIVVTGIKFFNSAGATVNVAVRAGFVAAGGTLAAVSSTAGSPVTGILASAAAIAPGTPEGEGFNGSIVGISGANQDLVYTTGTPTSGNLRVKIQYYLITES